MKQKKILLKILFFTIFVILCLSLPQSTQEAAPIIKEAVSNDQCMSCHGKMNCDSDIFPGSLDHSAHRAQKCTDCHLNVHKKSPTLELDINQSCAQCHESNCQEKSVHSNSLQGGPGALCTDCHGIHNIQPVDNPQSSVYKLNVHKTCTKCHQEILESYHYSFHGTAVSLGSLKAATCIDCHGSHEILPPTDPKSKVNEGNVPYTCAKCHKTPEPNFAKGVEHITPYDKDEPGAFPLWVIWKFFLALILLDIFKECSIAIFELLHKLRTNKKTNPRDKDKWDI